MTKNKVIVTKDIIRKSLVKEEGLAITLSRFIDNSIKAKQNTANFIEPCRINISILDDLIIIKDNSGGIDPNKRDDDIFKIGSGNIDSEGVGIKKSLFILGKVMNIESNNKIKPRKLLLDVTTDSDELSYQVEYFKYNPNQEEGTTIYISELEKITKMKISQFESVKNIIDELGRIYCRIIEKKNVEIYVNEKMVSTVDVKGDEKNKCTIMSKYEVTLYKATNKGESGIDLFINDYMYYNREKSKKVKWNLLNKVKHRYYDCIIEINCDVDIRSFLEDHDKLFDRVMEFVHDNDKYFISKVVTIQFEVDIGQVEELENYYEENTAKAIGIKAFNKLYEDFIENIKKQDGNYIY